MDPSGLLLASKSNSCSAEYSYSQCGGDDQFWGNSGGGYGGGGGGGYFGDNYAYYNETYGGMPSSVVEGLDLHFERIGNSQNGYGFITNDEYARGSTSAILNHPDLGFWFAGSAVWSSASSDSCLYCGQFAREMQRRTAPMAELGEGFMSSATDGAVDALDQREGGRANRDTTAFAIGAGMGILAGVLLPGPGKFKAVGVIKGFTTHAAQQAVTRGFTAPRILNIVRNGAPVQAMGRYGPQTRYTLGANTVVVNSQGKIVTVFSTASGTQNGLGRGFYIP